jgi:glutamate-1-semialdehyde 2,1-aminomutase
MNTSESGRLFERAKRVLVEGVGSASRGPVNYVPYPIYMREAHGARLIDVDGNEYLDWMLSFGALPLGHAPARIVELVQQEVARGTHFATAIEAEVQLAELILPLIPHAEKIRFANTGTEAAMAAIRLARGVTGRRGVIKFEGHYHGWYDAMLVGTNPQAPWALGHPSDPVRIPDSSGLTPGSWEDTVLVPWNNPDALIRAMALHGRSVACVVTEGIMANMGVIPPKPGYLQLMQDLCRQYGALFYLDETVTGFRVAAGGCAELFGLRPDITTYGKALGQGFPIAAIAGPSHIMDGLEWGKVLHYGSHNAPRLGLMVAREMLRELLADDGRGFRTLQELGDSMAEAIREVGRRTNTARFVVQNVGSLFQFYFTNREAIEDYRDFCTHVDRGKFQAVVTRLREKGVYMSPSNALHSLSCTAHTEDDVRMTADALGTVLDDMAV